MTRDEKVNLALSRAGIGGVMPTWTWDNNTWVPSRPEGMSESVYSAVVAAVQAELVRVRRKPKSLATLLTAINGLTNEQKQTLLTAAREAAENSDKTIVQVMGMLTWILTDATMRAKCVAGILRWEPGFARAVNIELDGDEAEE